MDTETKDNVEKELKNFHSNRSINSAFVFPPCNSFIRYQIHQIIHDIDEDLKSFSIGHDPHRRLVVGWTSEESPTKENSAKIQNQETSNSKKISNGNDKAKSRSTKKHADRQVYIPPQLRKQQVAVVEPTPDPPAVNPEEKSDKNQHQQNDPDDILEEIISHLGSKVNIVESTIQFADNEKSHNNYQEDIPWGNKCVIYEIHDFDTSLKTVDLNRELTNYRGKYTIIWVDDSHALAVFFNQSGPKDILKSNFKSFKIRPIAKGSLESKRKAQIYQRSCESKSNNSSVKRPQTSTLVANRMLYDALGMKMGSPEKMIAEKEKLRLARIKKNEKKQRAQETN